VGRDEPAALGYRKYTDREGELGDLPPGALSYRGIRTVLIRFEGQAGEAIKRPTTHRANTAPCSRCNISFVPSRERNFGLSPRLAQCKFVEDRGWAFGKQSIFRNPRRAPQGANALRDIFSVIRLQKSGMSWGKG
jgi:hypothetical protein